MIMRFDDLLSLSLRWEHPDKQRYYHIVLGQDLFGDWVITKAWGGISKATGRIMHLSCQTREDAHRLVEKIVKTREQRGYILKSSLPLQ